MKFNIIGFENKEEWAKIVFNGEIYYQWEYVDAFYRNGDGIPKLAYAELEDEYVYNVFFIRDIVKDLKLNNEYSCYDIITPYGYGGVNANTNNRNLINYFFKNFSIYCNQNKIVSEFVRFNPLLNNFRYYSDDYDIINASKTVYMKLDNSEQIWNDLESRCRNTIRKARNNNLEIKSGLNKKMLSEFIDIYNETMRRDNANSYYFFNDDFFDSILNNLEKNAKIYTVYYEGKAINSSIILFNGENAHYHLSGTLSEYMKLGANNFSLYEIAVDLCKLGYKKFHLGGGYGGDDSPLFKFKKSFNKNGELNFYIGKKIYNEKLYNELCKLENVDINESYFPAYRKQ